MDDPAVRAFVACALLRTGGDAERAADLMQLRLAQARPEDARVLELVLAEALAADWATDPGRVLRERMAAQRERVAALCARSDAVLDRGRRLRAWTTECVRRAHDRVRPWRALAATCAGVAPFPVRLGP